MTIQKETNDLVASVTQAVGAGGATRVSDLIEAQKLVYLWLDHYSSSQGAKAARELLDGTRAACIEAAAYQALGLGRAVVAGIRTQVDLLLSYTYFRDHPAEWKRLCETGEGFMLRGEIERYHRDFDPGFGARLGMLDSLGVEKLSDLYRIMSAHVHAQSNLTMPSASHLVEVVSPAPFLLTIPDLQRRVAAALSRYLVTIDARLWVDLPRSAVQGVADLFGKAEARQKFFQS